MVQYNKFMQNESRLFILTTFLLAIGISLMVSSQYVHQGLATGLYKAEATILNINQFIERRQTERHLRKEKPDAELLMPVLGVRVEDISDTWHHPRGNRLHEGQDIFAGRGTVIQSATEGIVRRVGVGERGGNYIFITGAGNRRYYYAHLDYISPLLKSGTQVTTNTILGFVGTTGNAEGTSPHLHFGVYTSNGAIDPLPLLVNRKL